MQLDRHGGQHGYQNRTAIEAALDAPKPSCPEDELHDVAMRVANKLITPIGVAAWIRGRLAPLSEAPHGLPQPRQGSAGIA